MAIGVVVTTLFGLGVLLALSPDSPPGLQEILFGDILGPTDADLGGAAALAVVVGIGLLALHERLLAEGFDPAVAAAARQLTDRIAPMIAFSVAIAVLAGIAGLYLSYYAGTAGGASVALAILAFYVLALPLGRLLSARHEKRTPVEATIG